ncbi:phosphoribosyltransferase [Azospirillum sp.]|uniref:phosphoribosyltransferase n=1 Tax=Azospirillum sp. TaxID=34012 RepID=UPI002D71B998|nr:phosphoribosyltransferase family protein [Azospirillum sp.]HYD64258.1 phosphoribosyltransferase family protein [Azospirillum sp.]
MGWFGSAERYADRRDAGRRLAPDLMVYKDRAPVVLGLARGGLAVGVEIARVLGCPLEPVFVRKIGVPHHEELAAGAVVDGPTPEIVTNPDVCRMARVPESYIAAEAARQLAEIARRRGAYLGDRPPADVAGRTAIVVDDGIATGASMRAALIAVRRAGPAALVMAVPVGADDTLREMEAEVDALVCPLRPRDFGAIGAFYRDFHQVGDGEVVALLREANGSPP